MTRPPRPRLNSESLVRLDERMGVAERALNQHDEEAGKVLAAVAQLQADVAGIKAMLEAREQAESQRPRAGKSLSSAAQAGLVTALVTVAQIAAELLKMLLHSH